MERDKYIQAFARCRPLGSSEKQTSIRLCTDNNEIITNEKTFLFDRVFGSGASQRDVFDVVVKPLIYEVLQGYNCTVFAYGPTGTGKTYTMEGDIVNQHQCGLIPRAVEYFSNLNEVCEVKVSFLQIYNEDIYDLLSPVENSTKLKLFDDKGSVLINGLEELKIVEKDDIHHIMNNSSARRRTAATLLNACSSRSHTIFTIKVRMKERIGKLNLVDLAGSESIGRSGAQDKRAREAGSINQSLLTLGRVVTALVERRPHIPYRESKLTRILQDSLGGSTQTSMIATISPSDNDVANTLSTLDYAARARKICNQLDTHPNISLQRSSDQSEKELQALREELNNVEMRVRNEVAEEFREQNEKIQLINCESRKKLEEDYNRSIAGLVEKCRIAEELAESRAKVIEELEAKCIEKEAALRQAKVFEELADYRGTLVDEFEKKMREKEMEIITLKEENRQKDELIQTMSNVETTKKANRIREKVPPTEESNDYANITFDDTDEILKVSTKKARKNIVAGVKRKHINHTITLSGKKKRIQAANDCDEDDLSPVAPTRVTRSRATRKKLEY